VFLFFSCEEPNDIGLDLLPDQDQVNVRFVELDVSTANVWFDSVNTTNTSRMLVGRYADPEFGNVVASTHMTVSLDDFASRIGTSAEYDSMRLELKANYIYGNSGNNINISLSFLTDTLLSKTYYRFDDVANESTVIGSAIFDLDISTSIDTVVNFKIDDSIGEDWFNRNVNRDDPVFDNQENFEAFSKGLTMESVPGSDLVLGFNVNDVQSRLILYYHNTGDSTASTYRMFLGNNSNAPTAYHFNSISSDFAASELLGQATYSDFQTPSGDIYLEAGVGILPKLDLQPLLDWENQTGNVLINRVDLIIDDVRDFAANEELPPSTLQLFFVDSNNQLVRSNNENELGNFLTVQNDGQLQTSTQSPLGVTYDINNNFYRASISSFVQALFDGTVTMDNPSLYILPTSFSETVTRFRVSNSSLKFRVYYTSLN
jgi:hypothetical protein